MDVPVFDNRRNSDRLRIRSALVNINLRKSQFFPATNCFKHAPGIYYAIPNFQNTSGLSYNLEKRRAVADLCTRYGTILVEDDPYGELRFAGEDLPTISSFMKGQSILLGTLSKIAAPGLRVG